MLKLIVNPVSGGKKASDAIPAIENALAAHDIRADISLTTAPGDATALALDGLREGYQRFGVVGGDGSVNEVVNGLVQADPPDQPPSSLAIFPAGSGNDLAATLEVTADADSFANRIAKGQPRAIDVCNVTVKTPSQEIQRYFINNLGLGLEADVTRRYAKVTWVQGHLRYLVAALQTIRSYSATNLSAEWAAGPDSGSSSNFPDSMQHGHTSHSGATMLVTVGNNRRAGGGFYLTPDAELDDGHFDAGILRKVNKLPLLKLLGQALQGKHTHDPNIIMLRTQSLSISCGEPLPIQADGELLATDAVQVEISLHKQPIHLYA